MCVLSLRAFCAHRQMCINEKGPIRVAGPTWNNNDNECRLECEHEDGGGIMYPARTLAPPYIPSGVTPRRAAQTLSTHATFQHPHLTLQWWDDFRWPLSIGAHSPALNITENILMGARNESLVNFQVDDGLSPCLRSPMCRRAKLPSLFTAKSYFLCFVKTQECFWPPAAPCSMKKTAGNFTFERTAFRAPPSIANCHLKQTFPYGK